MPGKVTTEGFNNMLKAWSGISGAKFMDYFGVGTGTTTPTNDDPALVAQLFRKILTQESVDGNVMTLEGFLKTDEAETTAGVAEMGIWDVLDTVGGVGFDSVSGVYPEVMHLRATVTPVVKASGETMRVTYTVTARNK
jgi:hypothetical protein